MLSGGGDLWTAAPAARPTTATNSWGAGGKAGAEKRAEKQSQRVGA